MGVTTERGAELNRLFVRDGYCHIPAVVPADLIEHLRAFYGERNEGDSETPEGRSESGWRELRGVLASGSVETPQANRTPDVRLV